MPALLPPRFDRRGPYDVASDDVVYARPDGVELLARIYRPVGDGAALHDRPALVDVHGGAWRYFDRQADAYFDRALAACGAVVVAIDFRQAPEHQWPAAAADVNAAIRWVKANAAALGVRATDVGLIGGSSGGHLVLVAALRPHAPELATTRPVGDRIDITSLGGGAGFPDPAKWGGEADAGVDGATDATCAYALALWPIAAPDWRYRYLLDRLAEPDFATNEPMFDPQRLARAHEHFFGDEASMAQASALRMVCDREIDVLPPVWMVQPELDENVTLEMAEKFAAAYAEAGGSITLEVWPGVGHSFVNFGGDAADACIEQMARFVEAQVTKTPEAPARVIDGREATPHKLAHVVLRVKDLDACVAWYETVLRARAVHRNPVIAFLTYDDEHHRLALVSHPDGVEPPPGSLGLEHFAFTYASLGDLLNTFVRLRDLGIEPYWCINHGPTISLYYRDPGGNQIELQVDCYPDPRELEAFFRSGAVQRNPIGVDIDPDDLLRRYRSGEPMASLILRDDLR